MAANERIPMPHYEDNFSSQAAIYARYRPTYPAGLFEYLAEIAPAHDLAWDCGCGNGQATLGIAEHFTRVIGTDASAEQIRQASAHGRVQYRVALAERSGLAPRSVDLVTVAQALHWFDLPKFYAEVKRVLKPGGVLAAWCYHLTIIAPTIDALLTRYYQEIVGPFWSPNVQLANEHYRDIPFPFEELQSPSFVAQSDWDLKDVIGYLTTWSATQRFLDVRSHSPVDNIREELVTAWGDPHFKRRVQWPLYLRFGKIP
jgi:SAM-dependent methyltransferase